MIHVWQQKAQHCVLEYLRFAGTDFNPRPPQLAKCDRETLKIGHEAKSPAFHHPGGLLFFEQRPQTQAGAIGWRFWGPETARAARRFQPPKMPRKLVVAIVASFFLRLSYPGWWSPMTFSWGALVNTTKQLNSHSSLGWLKKSLTVTDLAELMVFVCFCPILDEQCYRSMLPSGPVDWN